MSGRRTNGRIDDDDDYGGVEILDDENKLSQSQINDLKDEVKRGLTLIDGCVNQLAQAKWILINVEKTLNSKGKKGGVSSAKKGKPTPPAPAPSRGRAPPPAKKAPTPKAPTPRSGGGGSKRTAASKRSRANYLDKYHDILNGERSLKVVLEAIDHLVGSDTNFKGWDLERIEMELQEAVSKVNSSSTNHHSSYNNDEEDDELFSAPKEKKTKEDTSSLFDNLLKKTPDFKEKLRATFLNFSQTTAGDNDDNDAADNILDEEEKENADEETSKPPEDFKEKLRMAFAGFVSTTTKSSDDEGTDCKTEDVKMTEEPEEIDSSLMEIAGSINMEI